MRRFSRGSNEKDWELAMQLSAAIRHEDLNQPETNPQDDQAGPSTGPEPRNSAGQPPGLPQGPQKAAQHGSQPPEQYADVSNLIGSLSSALGQQSEFGASLPRDLPQAGPSNAPALTSQPAAADRPGTAPIGGGIDLNNLDLNSLGNLRLADLGIFGNLFNPNNSPSDIFQTLGTLSQIGNLVNQASRGQQPAAHPAQPPAQPPAQQQAEHAPLPPQPPSVQQPPQQQSEPDVGSIQRVLQNLFSNQALSGQGQSFPQQHAAAGPHSSPANLPSDQSLVDTLRSAMSSGPVAAQQPPSRLRKPRPASQPSFEQPTGATDFNASDTDTLRAIQQALLGSTGSASLISDTALAPSAPLIPDSRVSKGAARRPVSKVVEPSEAERQKTREVNAARKRRWRGVNNMQNKDNDLRARITKKAHELFGQGDSEQKLDWINKEFETRRNRRIVREGINSIVESAMARQEAASELGRAPGPQFLRAAGSGEERTLTQQSKQAASSHLSELFKNSNAALGSRVPRDNVPNPVAAYMLVSAPSRPPYKVTKVKPTEAGDKASEKVSEAAEGSIGEDTSNKEPEEPNKSTSEKSAPEKSAPEKSAPEKSAPEPAPEKSAPEPAPEKEPTDKPAGEPAPGNSESDKPVDTAESSKPEQKNDDSLGDTRPKHRYSVIGKLKLGVPPNLASVYRKIRGTTPLEHYKI